ncbi:DMT family transporter [Rhodopseudomonas palustris]|uniref:EamA domain-containing protein n=1 Tax=Rhodopseudomonas palustris (strain BisB18) TaxID=316056 RepID=Q212F0_RHOPB
MISPRDVARKLTRRHDERPFRGIVLIIAATVFLACSDALGKYLTLTLPSIEVAWLRFLVFVLIMVPVAMASGSSPLKSVRPGLQVLRGLALVFSSVIFISSLRYQPIAQASATSFVAPLFVTALSVVVLGETVGPRRWIATLVGLVGVLIVVQPGTAAFNPAALLTLASALLWAATLVMTRMISGADRVVTTMAFAAIVGFAVLSVLVPFVWVTPSLSDLGLGLGVGIASTAGQWIVVLAFRHAAASMLAPFSYIQLVWVTIIGVVVFGELPGLWTFVGAAIIIGSGIYTAHRERLRHLRQVAAEPYPSA